MALMLSKFLQTLYVINQHLTESNLSSLNKNHQEVFEAALV